MAENEPYKATGYFANRSIATFGRYVTDGALDVEAVKNDWKLNDAQIPQLEVELRAAGFLPKLEEIVAPGEASDITITKPLAPPPTDTTSAGKSMPDPPAPQPEE